MHSDQAGRRRLSKYRSALCGALLFALAGAAAARELEPGATLEGFPFRSPSSVAVTADGRDLYAGGRSSYSSPSEGFAWLKRDPDTGRLELRRNFFSGGESPRVLAVALSRGDFFLHVLTPNSILTYSRDTDGSLGELGVASLPADFVPSELRVSPLGSRLAVLGRTGNSPQVRFYDLSLAGSPVFRDTVATGGTAGVFMNEDLLVSDRYLLRRTGLGWATSAISALAGAGYVGPMLKASATRVYVRCTFGQFPALERVVVTLDVAGPQLVEVGRTSVHESFDREDTAFALHPASGDLYVASYDSNGGAAARIVRYAAAHGGASFTRANVLADTFPAYSGATRKESLTFSPDGRHLYATFGGEPLALIEAGIPLSYVPNGAGLHSHLTDPFKVVAVAPREAYVLTPSALLQTRWDAAAGDLELVSSLPLDAWPQWRRRPATDLVFTPGGGAGVLASSDELVMLERDRTTGAVSFLGDTTSIPPEGVLQLAISPDGRYVYAVGYTSIQVYYLRRDVPELVPVQSLPVEGSPLQLRLSDGGEEALLLRHQRSPIFLRRSIESGELEIVPFRYSGGDATDLQDALFSHQGRRLHLFRAASTSGILPGLAVALARQDDGSWTELNAREVPATPNGRQAVDPSGNSVYQLSREGLGVLELANRYHPIYRLLPLQGLSRSELGGVGAEMHDPVFREATTQLALLPGGELLVANRRTGNLRLFRRGCGADLFGGPCLAERRFRLEVVWRDADGAGWPAYPSDFGSDDAQIFSFFDPGNWELMVKVLDGCGLNDRFWVFAAASTDVAFDIRVMDTWTGERKTFSSAAGAPAPAITDTAAFATCGAPDPGWFPAAPQRPGLAVQPEGLELQERFVAKATWRTAAGQSGRGVGLYPGYPLPSGLIYFFDEDNWEVQLKVLDGCAINGHHWVLGAATTDVGYNIEVFDPVTGLTRTYDNPVGRASPAIIDIGAFPCN